MSTSTPFVCETFYHGWRSVEGSQSAAGISKMIDSVLRGVRNGAASDSTQELRKAGWEAGRVQLQLSEQQLRLVPLKRDEGFESDSDGSSGSVCEEQCCNSSEVKVIRDHVLRLDKLLRCDSSSPTFGCTGRNNSNTSGSCRKNSSSSTNSIHNNKSSQCDNIRSTSSGGANSSLTDALTSINNDACSMTSVDARGTVKKEDTASSSGAESEDETTAQINKSHNDVGISAPTPTLLPDRTHGTRSPDGGAVGSSAAATFMMRDILFCHISNNHPKVVVLVAKASLSDALLRAHILECLSQHAAKTLYIHYYKARNKHNLDRYRNTNRKSDVNKYGSSNSRADILSSFESNNDVFDSLRNCAVRKDSGTGSICETGSNRGSLRSNRKQSFSCENINIIEVKSQENSPNESQPFNLLQRTDNEGITHIEIESGPMSLLNGGLLPPDYSSIISLSTPETNGMVAGYGGARNLRNKQTPNGNSCPNSLLISEREIISATESERKFRQRQPALLLRAEEEDECETKVAKKTEEGRSRKDRHFAEVTKHRDNGRPPLPPPSSWALPDRPLRQKTITRLIEYRDHMPKNKPTKTPGPTPPPRRHPQDSSLLLVPTKSGHEPKKSYYPKESHIVRGNKVVRVDFPTVPVYNHRADPNNNARQYLHYTGGWAHEFHSPRMREVVLTSELRRRSRSKSPARKPLPNRYLDAVSTFNFSQKLKDFSDAVFSTKKNQGNSIVNSLPPIRGNQTGCKSSGYNNNGSSTAPCDSDSLRPVIKKGKQKMPETDNRRVTFSAYATVQLLNS
ncbi:hypothetical protein FHG87_008634 [Trinorchestia longiramus]|nr:hypothetical protein FHG87_008634 [Trinorchestia longiramus]